MNKGGKYFPEKKRKIIILIPFLYHNAEILGCYFFYGYSGLYPLILYTLKYLRPYIVEPLVSLHGVIQIMFLPFLLYITSSTDTQFESGGGNIGANYWMGTNYSLLV